MSAIQSKACHCGAMAVCRCTKCGRSLCELHRVLAAGQVLVGEGAVRVRASCANGCTAPIAVTK